MDLRLQPATHPGTVVILLRIDPESRKLFVIYLIFVRLTSILYVFHKQHPSTMYLGVVFQYDGLSHSNKPPMSASPWEPNKTATTHSELLIFNPYTTKINTFKATTSSEFTTLTQ